MSHDADSADPAAANTLEDLLAKALAAHEAGGDAALAAFLDAHASAAGALREALGDLRAADLMQAPPDPAPERLGEFLLRGTLGAGGMGIVYLAEQTSLGREVALKVVRPELLFFDGARERFRREIDAVAKLEHPAIVPILATGSADGVPYYAMPRIHGRSAEAAVMALAGRDVGATLGSELRALLGGGNDAPGSGSDTPFGGPWWRVVVRLVHQATLGIAHAHARGVLHRDLKPSNLMLTADGRAIVLDFGLAVARGDEKLTRTGTAAGSPAFMAPEQVRGGRADERTDVYGMGATLHCLLGLRAPFAGGDAEALKSQILAGARQRLAPGTIPVELRFVLEHAMDVDPARRYPSADAFADDLQAVLDGRPIAARRLPAAVRLQRFARRRRVLTTALAALALFLIVLPTILLWQQHRLDAANAVVQQEANEQLSEQVARADRSVKISIDAVQQLLATVAHERIQHVPAAQEVAAEMLRGAIALFDALRSDAAQSQRALHLGIQALNSLAQIEFERGRWAAALAAATTAVERLGDGDVPLLSRVERVVARRLVIQALIETNRHAEAELLLQPCLDDLAIAAAAQDGAKFVRNEAGNLHSLAAVLAEHRGDDDATERSLRSAIEVLDDRALVLAGTMTGLARFLRLHHRIDEGLRVIDEAIRLATDPTVPAGGWPAPKQVEAMARYQRADMLRALGRDADAIAEYRRAMVAFDAFLLQHPEEPAARTSRGANAHNLCLVLGKKDCWSEIRPLLEVACADQLFVLARDPGNAASLQFLANHRQSLATCLGRLGDLQALEPVARALAATPGNPLFAVGAARGLLRCAAGASDSQRTDQLRDEAVDLLVDAARRGAAIDFANALYEPIRDDPRLAPVRNR